MKIAITGLMGSGKSTVANIFRELGYPVFDADEVAKSFLKKDSKGYHEVLNTFGEDVLDEHYEIDKGFLAKLVFQNKECKEALEGIIHPLVKEALLKEMKNKKVFIAEVPLLFEAHFDQYFDEILYVDTSEEHLLQRLEARNMTKEEIQARLKNQMTRQEKKAKATYIIKNEEDIDALKKEVMHVIKKWGI
ncbi:MAG: dephospho-CoA kinase [Erysipelotrichaceae bacterium]|nr:dephospho-CoA kinase [Erysipelotrichaceae bacterium]